MPSKPRVRTHLHSHVQSSLLQQGEPVPGDRGSHRHLAAAGPRTRNRASGNPAGRAGTGLPAGGAGVHATGGTRVLAARSPCGARPQGSPGRPYRQGSEFQFEYLRARTPLYLEPALLADLRVPSTHLLRLRLAAESLPVAALLVLQQCSSCGSNGCCCGNSVCSSRSNVCSSRSNVFSLRRQSLFHLARSVLEAPCVQLSVLGL